MNGATPTKEDFMFEHGGVSYAIGYSALDETYCLSANIGGVWSWQIVESGIDVNLEDATGFLIRFLDEVNAFVFGVSSKEEPQFKNELEKLIYLTSKLSASGNKVTLNT